MTARELVKALELEGFRVAIWGRNRKMLGLHCPPGKAISREMFDALAEHRPGVVEYLRGRAGVRLASPQCREEAPTVETHRCVNDSSGWSDCRVWHASGHAQGIQFHPATNAGNSSKALRTWCIRACG